MSQKNRSRILTHTYVIWKDGNDEPICRAAVETQTRRTDLWTWSGGMRQWDKWRE